MMKAVLFDLDGTLSIRLPTLFVLFNKCAVMQDALL